jgi:hypothetical protein
MAWGLGSALVLLAGWWALVPRIQTADPAEVRLHIAPELLLPLPHPEGGRERALALRKALEDSRLTNRIGPDKAWRYDLADPQVSAIDAILRAGPLDRAYADNGISFFLVARLADGLTTVAREQARAGQWRDAGRQMEAAFRLLDRMVESNGGMYDQAWTVTLEKTVFAAALDLAGLDPPEDTARLLSVLLESDRHGPDSFMQFLRGAMQFSVLPWLADFEGDDGPTKAAFAGNYDPIDTARLVSDLFLEQARNVGVPASQRSTVVAERLSVPSYWNPGYSDDLVRAVVWSWRRIRLNTTHNSIGKMQVAALGGWDMLDAILRTRTLQAQATAAVAVTRFRRSAGRDPGNFDELIAAGLMQAAPLDHFSGQPLPFDLRALFEPPRPFQVLYPSPR